MEKKKLFLIGGIAIVLFLFLAYFFLFNTLQENRSKLTERGEGQTTLTDDEKEYIYLAEKIVYDSYNSTDFIGTEEEGKALPLLENEEFKDNKKLRKCYYYLLCWVSYATVRDVYSSKGIDIPEGLKSKIIELSQTGLDCIYNYKTLKNELPNNCNYSEDFLQDLEDYLYNVCSIMGGCRE